MKVALITLCFIGAILAEEKYESLNENFDVSEMLSNERLLDSYTKCLLSKGPCTPEVKQIKEKLPEALATRCAKCTDKQKQMGKQLAQGLKKTRPELWTELVAMYDPNGKYQAAFKDFLE